MIPAETQILDLIGPRLANITKANGYANTVEAVERGALETPQLGDVPMANYWIENNSIEYPDYETDAHSMRVNIHVRGLLAAKEDGNYPDQASQLVADIVTALNRSIAAPKVSDNLDCDLSGLVSSLKTPFLLPMVGEGARPWYGALVQAEIDYNAPTGDMFTFEP